MRARGHALRRALIATPAIHGISYALLIGWYWMASGTSLMTQLEVVEADDIRISEPFALFYLAPEGSQVFQKYLDNSEPARLIAKVAAADPKDRLFVRPRATSGFDLFVLHLSGDGRSTTEACVLEDFAEEAPVDWGMAGGHSEKADSSWFNIGPVPLIGGESDSKTRINEAILRNE